MRPRRVLVLLALIAFATVMFGIGVAVEKASAGPASTTGAHQESPGAEAGGKTGPEAPAGSSTNQEAILGFNPESTPLIVAAVVGSLGVLGAMWLYWRRALVLWAGGAVMAAFAVLDIFETAHQLVEGHATLVTISATVAVLHIAAAAMAVRLATAPQSMERATAS